MSISNVVGAIRQVRLQLHDYPQSGYPYNEATTRNVVINPMITALGWNLHNLDKCGYEIDPKGELWGKIRRTMFWLVRSEEQSPSYLGAEAGRFEPGGSIAGVGVARIVRDAAPAPGVPHGTAGQAGVRPSAPAARKLQATEQFTSAVYTPRCFTVKEWPMRWFRVRLGTGTLGSHRVARS